MLTNEIGFNSEYSEDAPTLDQIHLLKGDAILEFGASWCGYCQAASGVIKEAFSMPSFACLTHTKIADGKGKRLGRSFKVKLWPTLILLRDGQEIARVVRPTHANDFNEFSCINT